ncbi:MAG: DUF58 domain-containing protein [Fimbriimonadia bacterium]|nr:DUF58 domain-containing protein [Fimbriimonadia bacterium]
MVFTPIVWGILLLSGLLALVGISNPLFLSLAVLLDGALLVAMLIDALTMPRASDLEVTRHHEDALSLGAQNRIELEVVSRARRLLQAQLREEPPPDCQFNQRLFPVTLLPHQPVTVHYWLTPKYRGETRFQDVFLKVEGALKLVKRHYRIPAREGAKVYPNLLQIREYELLRHRGLLRQIGFRQLRLRGTGTEFESLRDYTSDDEFRKIDWKATARRGKPIVRDYETERSQNVVLLLDAGRNMLSEVEGIRKFDTVLNVALMLAYVAVLMDDKVGAMSFADEVLTFAPPQRGRQQVAHLVDVLHDQQPRSVEPDYFQAVTYLRHRWRKRSLVVVFTDLIDPESSRALLQSLKGLSRHHLCVCVTVADPRVRRLSSQYPRAAEQMYTRAVATQVLTDRAATVRALERLNVHVIDTEPENLVKSVVNFYTSIKARGAL